MTSDVIGNDIKGTVPASDDSSRAVSGGVAASASASGLPRGAGGGCALGSGVATAIGIRKLLFSSVGGA
eukprot:1382263-Pleurochrysis_carterae.AAC.1